MEQRQKQDFLSEQARDLFLCRTSKARSGGPLPEDRSTIDQGAGVRVEEIEPTPGENTGEKRLAIVGQQDPELIPELDTQVPQAETFSSAGELLVLEVDARSDHP